MVEGGIPVKPCRVVVCTSSSFASKRMPCFLLMVEKGKEGSRGMPLPSPFSPPHLCSGISILVSLASPHRFPLPYRTPTAGAETAGRFLPPLRFPSPIAKFETNFGRIVACQKRNQLSLVMMLLSVLVLFCIQDGFDNLLAVHKFNDAGVGERKAQYREKTAQGWGREHAARGKWGVGVVI